jgi:hypothetical protein
MLQAATADQLRRGATERLNTLRKKWANPESRRRAIQILLSDHTQDVNELDPNQPVPGVLYTSAMLDMPIGIGANPNMTVRDAFLIEIQNMAEAQQMEFAEQLAEQQDKQAKMEMQQQQNETKRQQQAYKDMFAQMKMQEQLRQWNKKVEDARQKELTDEQKLVEIRRQQEIKEQEARQQEKEKARQEALREPVARIPLTARLRHSLVQALEGEQFDDDHVRIEGNELLVTDPEYLDLIAERLEIFNEENEQQEALDREAEQMREVATKTRKKQEKQKQQKQVEQQREATSTPKPAPAKPKPAAKPKPEAPTKPKAPAAAPPIKVKPHRGTDEPGAVHVTSLGSAKNILKNGTDPAASKTTKRFWMWPSLSKAPATGQVVLAVSNLDSNPKAGTGAKGALNSGTKVPADRVFIVHPESYGKKPTKAQEALMRQYPDRVVKLNKDGEAQVPAGKVTAWAGNKPKPEVRPRVVETGGASIVAVPLSQVELDGDTVTRPGNLLERIASAPGIPIHKKLLAKALQNMFARLGLPTIKVNTETDGAYSFTRKGKKYGGTFTTGIREVVVGAKISNGNLQFSLDTLLHELIHAVTTEALTYVESQRGGESNLPANKELSALYDIMNSLYKQAKKANKKRNKLFGGKHYGLTNIHEFVAEAFANPSFQEFLATVQTENKGREFNTGLWGEFKRAVFDFLGIENRHQSLLDSVFSATESIMEANVSEGIDLLRAFPVSTFAVPPPKSQHKGAWAPATIGTEKVEVQQGPHITDPKTGLKDTRWVTIRRRNPDGSFKKGHEKKRVKVTTLGKWLAASNGRPGTPLHQAFGLPAPPSPGTPTNPPPPTPPVEFNVKDPDQKRPGWQAWAAHLMRWGSQIEHAYGRVGQLLNRYGHDAGQLASSMKGTLKFNMDKAEEWAKKKYPTIHNRGFSGRISGPFKEYFGFLLSGKSIMDELTKVGTDKWGVENEAFLREARAKLGFDPGDLYSNLNTAQANAEIKEAQKRGKAAKDEQERMYWERRAHYIATALHYHADAAQKGELRVIKSLDQVSDPNIKFLLPPLMAARASHDQAFIWRENLGLNPDDMVDHTQNHTYEGLSPEFFDKIRKQDPSFENELASVAKEIYDEALKDPTLFERLGLNSKASPAAVKQQVIAEARASLSQNTSSAFAKHSPKFGAFVKERRGLYGITAANWALSGSFDYIDKAGRDISYNRMARDFWLTKKDTTGKPVNPEDPNWHLHKEDWFFHGLDVKFKKAVDINGNPHYELQNKNIDDTMEQILTQAGQADAFKGVFGYGPEMVSNYILHVRGREMKDGPARVASKLAKFQYLTKLGNFLTVATNMTVLFTLGAILSPTNMARTIWHTAFNWNDALGRATKSGAVDPQSDPMAEFMGKGAKAGDNKAVRALHFTEMAMGLAFQTSETVIRTITANAAESYFKANVEVLKDPSKAGIFKAFGISSVKEARLNLSDILGLTDAEINAIEKGTVSDAVMEQISLKAMYRGSNEINFKHGSQYVPQMFSRNNALSIFARVFRSFAYNVLAFKAKLFGKPLRDAALQKDPELAKISILRMAKVYGGAFLTAQALKVLADSFKDDDDEENLRGEGQVAMFAWNRLNDLNTVGMFGLMQDPLSITDPLSFVGGVNLRTWQNVVDYGQSGLLLPAEDLFKGRFGPAFDQFMHSNIKILQKEVTHVRMLNDGWKKYAFDRRDYDQARQVSRALYLNNMTTLEKVRYKKQKFQPSPYAKERDAVVKALASGEYGKAMLVRKEFIQRIMTREEVPLKEAINRAKQSVMMKAPLSEWSRTATPEKSTEQLLKFLGVTKDIKDRRDKAEAKRFAAAHLHYVRAVNALFPSLGK